MWNTSGDEAGVPAQYSTELSFCRAGVFAAAIASTKLQASDLMAQAAEACAQQLNAAVITMSELINSTILPSDLKLPSQQTPRDSTGQPNEASAVGAESKAASAGTTAAPAKVRCSMRLDVYAFTASSSS